MDPEKELFELCFFAGDINNILAQQKQCVVSEQNSYHHTVKNPEPDNIVEEIDEEEEQSHSRSPSRKSTEDSSSRLLSPKVTKNLVKSREERQLAVDILMSLDSKAMNEIRQHFLFRNNKMMAPDFIKLFAEKVEEFRKNILQNPENGPFGLFSYLRTTAPVQQNNNFSLYGSFSGGGDSNNDHLQYLLSNIFSEIDVDADQLIDYDELIAYLIQSSTDEISKRQYDPIRHYQLVASKPDWMLDEPVKKLIYFPNWNKVAACGRSKKCKIINTSNMQVEHVLPDHDGTVLHAEYIPNKNFFVTSAADLCVRFWDIGNEYDLHNEYHLEASHTVVKYVENFDLLLSADRNGYAYVWKWGNKDSMDKESEEISLGKEMYSLERLYFSSESGIDGNDGPKYSKGTGNGASGVGGRLHYDVVMDIIYPDAKRNTFYSCSLGARDNIKVWDANKETVLQNLRGHKKGVFSIDYLVDFELVISGGYEYEPFVWLPNMKKPTKLKDSNQPHQHALKKIVAVQNTPQIISADHKGMIKIWDIRTYKCIQTICTESPQLVNQAAALNLLGASGASMANEFLVQEALNAVDDDEDGGPISDAAIQAYNAAIESAAAGNSGGSAASAAASVVSATGGSGSGANSSSGGALHKQFCLNTLEYLGEPHNSFITAGPNRILKFDYQSIKHPFAADDVPCSTVCYNPVTLHFITAHNRTMKLWDALTGLQCSIFENITETPITTIAVRNEGRQVVVGTQSGEVCSISILNGKRISSEEFHSLPHYGEITSLTYSEEKKMLLITSSDQKVQLIDMKGKCFLLEPRFNPNSPQGTTPTGRPISGVSQASSSQASFANSSTITSISTLQQVGRPKKRKQHHHSHPHADYTCSDISKDKWNLAIVGDISGDIKIYDPVSYAKLKELKLMPYAQMFANPSRSPTNFEPLSNEIMCVHFMGDFGSFLCSDSVGNVYIFTLGNNSFIPFTCVASWVNPIVAILPSTPQAEPTSPVVDAGSPRKLFPKKENSSESFFVTEVAESGSPPQQRMPEKKKEPEIVTSDDLYDSMNESSFFKKFSQATPVETNAVHSIIFDFPTRSVFTGDEKGFITKWKMDSFLVRFNGFKQVIDPVKFAKQFIPLQNRWKAHENCEVTGLQLIKDPPCLLSFSKIDGNVRIWTKEGQLMDCLAQVRKEFQENFPVQMFTSHSSFNDLMSPQAPGSGPFNFPISALKRKLSSDQRGVAKIKRTVAKINTLQKIILPK